VIKKIQSFSVVLVLLLSSSVSWASAAYDGNRAIGLSHSAPGLSGCLQAARLEGWDIDPETRGYQDENGEFTIWTVVFYGGYDIGGNRKILAVVQIESWEVTSYECRL